ncbi:MAG: dihydroorotase [Bacteroidaceae bacterium]|nr:dihydroorotase [Bacteroidaceae bacterium]
MILIKDATIINNGESQKGSLLINGDRIERVAYGDCPQELTELANEVIDAKGLWLIPGAIDDQVHFREPGLTHKADIASESRAAVAGGITSFMDMPNTNPQTTTIENINWKFDRAAETSLANYSFYIGATNNNIDELLKADFSRICGVKLFLGSSTGNMLVNENSTLNRIFSEVDAIIAIHSEAEEVIKRNREFYVGKYGEDLPVKFHPLIRDAEACYASTAKAVELATRHNARLHVLHISTAKELTLLEDKPLREKRITSEVCTHHLYFDDRDYKKYGNLIKWNPSIKSQADRDALRDGFNRNLIDIVATDHAPHLPSEKEGNCLKAASGGPLIQFTLLALFEMAKAGIFKVETIVEKSAHAPALLYGIKERGYIKEGYFADLVLVNPNRPYTVDSSNILSKCGWSPFMGHTFPCSIEKTFVNGALVYNNGTIIEKQGNAKELVFSC